MVVARKKPAWRRFKEAIADIRIGLYPHRAFDYHQLPQHWLEDPRVQARIRQAEAAIQRDALVAIQQAGTKGYSEHARQEETLDGDTDKPTRSNGSGSARALTGRARVRTWQSKDWKAPAWLVERRFPAEWGQQQPAQTAEAIVQVLQAMAALRGQPAPELTVRKRKQLEAPPPTS